MNLSDQSSLCQKVKQIYKSEKMFLIEKYLMKTLGLFPLNLWKVTVGIALEFIFILGPSIHFMLSSIVRKEMKLAALAAPQLLLNTFCLSLTLVFIMNEKILKEFLAHLEKAWQVDEANIDEKWEEIKRKRVKFCNRLSIFSQIFLHCNGIVYFFIPTIYYSIQRFFMGRPETYTVFMVE